jgi:hypothetical protein
MTSGGRSVGADTAGLSQTFTVMVALAFWQAPLLLTSTQ